MDTHDKSRIIKKLNILHIKIKQSLTIIYFSDMKCIIILSLRMLLMEVSTFGNIYVFKILVNLDL